MEEEIDLRPYIESLVDHWQFIVGLAVLTAVIAFIIASFKPPSYEAVALVVVTVPQELVLESVTAGDFDPRLSTVNRSPYADILPELAVSGEVLQKLLQELEAAGLTIENVAQLQKMLKVEAGDNHTVIRLTVTAGNPEQAAKIANTWCSVLVSWANEVLGNNTEKRVLGFEVQRDKAQAQLDAIDEVLAQFQAGNRKDIIQNTLLSYNRNQSDLLESRQDMQVLLQDARDLQTQVQGLPRNANVSFVLQLAALNLQSRAFAASAQNVLQTQINFGAELTQGDRDDLLNFLASFIAMLEDRVDRLETEQADLEPQILTLQQQLQEAEAEHERLSVSRSEAKETYIALSRKVIEEQISAQSVGSGVRLGSRAIVPVEPSGGRLLPTAVAGMLGGLTAMFIVFFRQLREEWRQA